MRELYSLSICIPVLTSIPPKENDAENGKNNIVGANISKPIPMIIVPKQNVSHASPAIAPPIIAAKPERIKIKPLIFIIFTVDY